MPRVNIEKFLNKNSKNGCPFCGKNEWSIDGERGFLKPNPSGEYVIPGEIERYLIVTCKTCAFTRILSIKILLESSDVSVIEDQVESSTPVEPKPAKSDGN